MSKGVKCYGSKSANVLVPNMERSSKANGAH